MNTYYPELLLFYPFQEYGKSGIRYRESDETVARLENYRKNKENILMPLTYKLFQKFVSENYDEIPSYIQLEHVQPFINL